MFHDDRLIEVTTVMRSPSRRMESSDKGRRRNSAYAPYVGSSSSPY